MLYSSSNEIKELMMITLNDTPKVSWLQVKGSNNDIKHFTSL